MNRNTRGSAGGRDDADGMAVPVYGRVPSLENLPDKKGGYDAGAVWLEALGEFEDELHGEVEPAGADQLRFQTGELFRSLVRRIKAVASGKGESVLMFGCYEFATTSPRCVGYGEARRMHGEELKWRGLVSAGKFCAGMPKRFAVAPEAIFLEELRSRVRSIAAWMECQESFALWLVFRDFSSGWRGSSEERARAIAAINLSRMHLSPERVRVRTSYDGKPWSDAEWRNILRQAADLTRKGFSCAEMEKWVWWAYPVFARYGWNAREVLKSAQRRGFSFSKGGVNDRVMIFQKDWIRRGLRFSGGKQRKDRVPPLAGFVESMVLPDPRTMWGPLGGLLFLPKKKR